MNAITDFSISADRPAQNPELLQLYSLATPNGVKISIALEELGIPYEVHRISIMDGEQFKPGFLDISPNNKIPAIIDPNGPGGKPVSLFESGAILTYLAEKSGRLLPAEGAARYEVLQWLSFQLGGVGPMFGQLGYFTKFAGKEIEDPRPRERYIAEGKRILGVIDKRMAGREWIAGEYSIADIAIVPWLQTLSGFYDVADLLGLDDFQNVTAYVDRFAARPAVTRGWAVPANPS